MPNVNIRLRGDRFVVGALSFQSVENAMTAATAQVRVILKRLDQKRDVDVRGT